MINCEEYRFGENQNMWILITSLEQDPPKHKIVGGCYEKLLRDSIIRVYANLVQKLREYLISLCHGD